VVAHGGLLQGLAGLLQQREESAVVLQVVVLVRMVVLGNDAAQLAVARVPGMCAALVQLLSCEEVEVADEAAETLAALQHDSSEAQQLVLAASKRVPLRLRA
jgi:hypothetical protein